MLERLYIKNFALIEELTLNLCEKFNVLTGETGAGKSIFVDAVSMLLGGRAQTEFIRSGTDKAVIEGVFLFPFDHPVFSLLNEWGIEEAEQEIILTRELSINGRNTCRINGRTFTLAQYRQFGQSLIDIHGQHDHQNLLQADKHLDILDKFAPDEHQILLQEVSQDYLKWVKTKKELEELYLKETERLALIESLQYKIKEIDQARIKPGELEELNRELSLLNHAEKIINETRQAYNYLFGNERGPSAYDLLSKALNHLHEVVKYDSHLEKIITQLEPALYVVEETSSAIRGYCEEIDYSPQHLETLEKRRHFLKDLIKKYGESLEDVLAYAQKSEEKLENLLNITEQTLCLEKKVKEYDEIYEKKAQQLSENRKEVAKVLERKVINELKDLAMPNAEFSVYLIPQVPTKKGKEQVEFFISPNIGEPLLPLVRIASGGELSRFMLALKTIMASSDGIGTLIFDEIDAGMGGKAAQKVAEKLKVISNSQQVICVTHSPIIAALADHHFQLTKEVSEKRTKTKVRYLEQEERIAELMRMLGGENQTEELRQYVQKIVK